MNEHFCVSLVCRYISNVIFAIVPTSVIILWLIKDGFINQVFITLNCKTGVEYKDENLRKEAGMARKMFTLNYDTVFFLSEYFNALRSCYSSVKILHIGCKDQTVEASRCSRDIR